jgi:hypothetical protein
MTIPETHFYRKELERAMEEMAFAVKGYTMGNGAKAFVRTLEGGELLVECVNDGFKVSRNDSAFIGGKTEG